MALGLLAGCSSVPLERSAMQPAQLLPLATLAPPVCAYRLDAVSDRRAAGTAAGSLGAHAFSLDDAADLVRQRLMANGFRDDPALPALSLEIRQLYIAANQSSKVPVAVYRVSVDGGPPTILRSHAASVNWNGTEAESQRAIARALDDVDLQLRQMLDARCGSRHAAD
ncbi:hypothetical protein FZO89_09010 [Luteimonas viscosa]|uniref:Uncharacterized protein n=1 Tax=Luteimonas viscosa TaxID=1132694 RepID=A0A5D4XNZ8_9GAMM|nr:hypothetical protein [Luteimonas viscosa]TYT26386.1 hypothetical protein FZO89_09010 [Luteimonas viscosa]